MSQESPVIDVMQRARQKVLEDPDGNALRLAVRRGAPARALNELTQKAGTPLPSQFVQLYSWSNGLGLFGFELLGVEEMIIDSGSSGILCPLHSWGNGDFDYLCIASRAVSDGSILFARHSTANVRVVAGSLADWLERLMREIEEYGDVAHPGDYLISPERDGVYRHIEVSEW